MVSEATIARIKGKKKWSVNLIMHRFHVCEEWARTIFDELVARGLIWHTPDRHGYYRTTNPQAGS